MLSYALEDFLMFSPAIYQDLVAQYNTEAWPLHLLLPVLLVSLFGAKIPLRFQSYKTLAPCFCIAHLAITSMCLFAIGKTFFIEKYSSINWAASYFAYAYYLQSALVISYALWLCHNFQRINSLFAASYFTTVELILLSISIVAYPVVEALQFSGVAQISVAGVGPQPSLLMHIAAIFALGLPRWLLILPTILFIFGALTHLAIGDAAVFLDAMALLLLLWVFVFRMAKWVATHRLR